MRARRGGGADRRQTARAGWRPGALLGALLLLTLGPLGAACGGPEQTAYRDRAHHVDITYDAAAFAEGTLAKSARIAAAERAAGAEPVTVVELVARRPGGAATGLRVAVFEGSRDVGTLGFWRVVDAQLDGALAKARAAVAPAVVIGEPFRVSVQGLQGYAARLTVGEPEQPAAGVGLALWRAPYVYEVIVLCRDADRRLLGELTRMLVDLRLGSGPPLAP